MKKVLRLFAIFTIRVPIMGTLMLLAWIGEKADDMGHYLEDRLPRFTVDETKRILKFFRVAND